MYCIVRYLLFCLPAEFAHHLVLLLIDCLYPVVRVKRVRRVLPSKPVNILGLSFPNPLGLAAGLDKDGQHIDALFGLGFGFIEVGAVTPLPQSGNAKPRLFRLPGQQALINRLGFNNQGVDALVRRLQKRKVAGIVGVNIGKNRTTPLENAHEDYLICYRKLYPYADFVTINVSSPNTRDLTNLQQSHYLSTLLEQLKCEQQRLAKTHARSLPFLVKVSPDLSDVEINTMADIFVQLGIEGIVATNTTQDRSQLAARWLSQAGGLSGRPLQQKTQRVVRCFAEKTQHRIPIIAVGGIFSCEDAQTLLNTGASLVQIYTGLIYQGPRLVKSIIEGLSK